MSNDNYIYIVIVMYGDRYTPFSCIGSFCNYEKALEYARNVAINRWIEEDLCVTDEDLMCEDNSQFNMSIEHDDSDLVVIIDPIVTRDYEIIEVIGE